jgi:hypothetical protein
LSRIIGESDLLSRLVAVLQPGSEVLGVNHRDDAVELCFRAHFLVDKEGLCHRRRVREARGLDQNAIELALALQQVADDADQIAAHGAANASVVHFEHFLVGVHDQLVVDADLAELVDDHRVSAAVLFGKHAVEERRFPGAEIAGQHRYRDGGGFGHGRTPDVNSRRAA